MISFNTFCLLHKALVLQSTKKCCKAQHCCKAEGVLQSTKGCCKAQVFVCVCVHMCAEPHIKLLFDLTGLRCQLALDMGTVTNLDSKHCFAAKSCMRCFTASFMPFGASFKFAQKSVYDPNFLQFFVISTLIFCSLCW